jgi:hypothetical protein
MNKVIQIMLIVSMLFVSSLSLHAQTIPNDSLYLGQTPPGNTPKIFTLPVTSGLRPCERIAITSDGKEIYFGELNTYPPTNYRVKCLKYFGNKWQGPFNVFEGFTAPKLSVDDSILYVQNNNFFTFYSKRTITGWSVPVRLLAKNLRTHYFQKTDLNNSYASSYYEGSPANGDLSKLIIANQDTVLQSLGTPLNSLKQENDFFIAADESYVFFSQNVTNGAGDIYLSFKKDNGGWTNPKKLGAPINKSGYSWEYGQFVTKDNKYLFFTSGGTSMASYYTYWVKIDNIIDSLKHTNFSPYLNYQIPTQSVKVGNLFGYTVPDSTFVDDDGNNTLSFSATQNDGNPLPAWLSFDTLTQTFSGTPTSAANIRIKLSAKDSGNVIISCMFEINITTVSSIEKTKETLPKTLNLFQNFPNPFNPITTINYTLPKAGNVVLKVYNALGGEVATLVNNYKEMNHYSVEFDASHLSSGMYFYQLTCDGFNIIKKMIFMK